MLNDQWMNSRPIHAPPHPKLARLGMCLMSVVAKIFGQRRPLLAKGQSQSRCQNDRLAPLRGQRPVLWISKMSPATSWMMIDFSLKVHVGKKSESVLYNQSPDPDIACAIPAEPAATARNTHGICSEKKPVVSPTMGIAAASTKFTMADFRQPQYHKPAPRQDEAQE